MRIIDISMEISEDMIYYPGNPSPEIEKYREIPEDSTTESRICIGSHNGTHVDAPEHVEEDGRTAETLELEDFYGEAQVLDLTDCEEKVDRNDLEAKSITEKIVLLKTGNALKTYESFREDFTYLTLEGVEYLIEEDVATIGIDYLSLVKFNAGKDGTEAHRKANQEMNVIEGLDLREVEPGSYVFTGLPLKIGTDGAPIRAALIDK